MFGAHRRSVAIALTVAVGVGVAGVVALQLTATHPLSAAQPTPAAAPSAAQPTPLTRPGELKPAIHGLLYLQGPPPASVRSMFAGYDVQGPGDYGGVSWAQLQASPGGPIIPDNPIDQAITDVQAWNASNPEHQEVLLVRIEAGIHSPAWAKNLGGPCVEVTDPQFGTTGCTPRFWTPQFGTAFYQFESELAADYDSVPEIGEVIISRNMTIYNEPLLRQTADPTSVAKLLAAGYTTAVDEQNQRSDIAALGSYWKFTRVGFTFNPYQTLGPNGQDEDFTQQLMAYGRQVLGLQLVLTNDSLRVSFLQGGEYATMYAAMKGLGTPIGFQTAVLSNVGNLLTTLQGAASLGASYVELPPGVPASEMGELSNVVLPQPS